MLAVGTPVTINGLAGAVGLNGATGVVHEAAANDAQDSRLVVRVPFFFPSFGCSAQIPCDGSYEW